MKESQVRDAGGEAGESAPVFTIFATHCPFRRDGSPVMGNMGSSVRGVIVIEVDTWKAICAAHPSLATQKFNVGSV